MSASHTSKVELVRHSGCVMDCHATTLGSIPDGDGVKPSFASFAKNSK